MTRRDFVQRIVGAAAIGSAIKPAVAEVKPGDFSDPKKVLVGEWKHIAVCDSGQIKKIQVVVIEE